MNLPEVGSMILDRKTSLCWKVAVSERFTHYEGFEEWESMSIECVGYDGSYHTLDDSDLFSGERYVFLEPMQVLDVAKCVTEQALSCKDAKIQRELCLKAIWLLQWFEKETTNAL